MIPDKSRTMIAADQSVYDPFNQTLDGVGLISPKVGAGSGFSSTINAKVKTGLSFKSKTPSSL
jgi:hypothetical protein